MIGASTSKEFGEGKTFPGTVTPFGLVQLRPDAITAAILSMALPPPPGEGRAILRIAAITGSDNGPDN
jgi:putative alpha-1,2-mannosidase